MSDLQNLMDDMLSDAGASIRAEEEAQEQKKRAALAEARAEREREAREAAEHAAAEAAAEQAIPKIEGPEGLLDLSSADLQKVLDKLNPNDLLIVLAKGSDALQRRLLANLSKDSVQWLRQNLEYLGDPADLTEALAQDSRRAAVTLTNKMLRAGVIDLVSASDGEEGGAGDAASSEGGAEGNPLLTVLTELVAVAHKAGPSALAEVVDDPGDPLLAVGLAAIGEGTSDENLAAALQSAKATLEATYRARLNLVETAVMAMSRGESPETFVASVKKSE